MLKVEYISISLCKDIYINIYINIFVQFSVICKSSWKADL